MVPSTEQLLAEVASLRAALAARQACAACQALPAPAPTAQRAAPPKPPPAISHTAYPRHRVSAAAAHHAPAVAAHNTSNNSSAGSTSSSPREVMSHCSDVSGGGGARRVAAAGAAAEQGARPGTSAKKTAGARGGVQKPGGRSRRDRTPAAPKPPGQSRYWTPDEHKLFLEALNRFGHKDLKAISAYVGSRNMTQVRTHSQKYFMRLMREAKRQNPVNASSAPGDDSEACGGADAGSVVAASSAPPAGEARATAAATAASASASALAAAAAGMTKSEADATDSVRPAAAVPVADDAGSPCVDEPSGERPTSAAATDPAATGDKYSVPSTCGMMLLCLVGQDTLTTT